MAKLIELAELERRVTGPERLLREEDVAVLVKGAYDDAGDEARATFVARVKAMPTSAWPWSAVQAMTTRGAAGLGTLVPRSGGVAPAVLLLLRGQPETADADPGDRLPERDQPQGAAWEPLHRALDSWDTATIKKWIAPHGWMTPGAAAANQVPASTGGATPTGGSNEQQGAESGASTPPSPATPFSWRHPAVIAAGATMLTTVGVVLYGLSHGRSTPAVKESNEP